MRKLAYFAYAFSAAALLCAFMMPLIPILLPVSIGLFAGVWFLVKPEGRYRVLRPLALGMVMGMFWCGSRNILLERDAAALCGESRETEVTVLTYPVETDYGVSLEVRAEGLRCRLYLDEKMELIPGERLLVTARFVQTAEKTDSDSYLARGIPLFGYADGTAVVVGYSAAAWRYWPAKVGFRLRESISACFDEDTAAFLKAILTGERHELQERTLFYTMMKRAGLVHCVAVSGMHLSFLVTFLYVLLGKGTLGSIFCIPVTILFMAITGFTPSVVRAGVMQLSLCLSGLVKREYDSDTALAFSLLLLLLCNPYSILNAGLQLSFTSTLGIIHFSQPITQALPHFSKRWEQGKLSGRLLRYVRSSLAVSLSALILTLPLTALYFEQYSIVAPLTNMLSLWAVSVCFCFGLVLALLGLVWPLGAIYAGYPLRWLVRYIRLVAELLGKLPFASLNAARPILGTGLLLCCLLLLYFRWMPGIRHRFAGYLLTAAIVLLSAFGLNCLYEQKMCFTVTALDVGQGQCIVFSGKNYTLVADCGGSGSRNAGDVLADHLLEQGRLGIDILLLTHYHQDHSNGVSELMARVPIRQMIVPPSGQNDEGAASILLEAEARGIAVATVSEAVEHWTLGDMKMTITPPLGETGDNEQGLCLLCSDGNYDVLLTGDAGELTEQRLLERVSLPDIELLIAGHHGSRKSVCRRLLDSAAPDTVVISVGRSAKGLPAEETLERIRSSGAMLYCTDEVGTIRIRCQKGTEQNE